MTENDRPSFLARLIKSKAGVLEIGNQTAKNVGGAVAEVDRQIKQATKGSFITGKGVTKSGKED